MSEQDAASATPFFFTKQALFDVKRKLWGYEIQGGNDACAALTCFADREHVAALAERLRADGFTIAPATNS